MVSQIDIDYKAVCQKAFEMTIQDYIKLEPGIGRLIADCQAYKPILGKNCPLTDWYKDYKPRLLKLVRFFTKTHIPELRTHVCYDRVYKAAYDSMKCPAGCRGCSGG